MLKLSAAAMIPKVLISLALADIWVDSDLYKAFYSVLIVSPLYWVMILLVAIVNIMPFFFMRRWYLLVSCPKYANWILI